MMKKKITKIICALLSAVFVFGMLSGCDLLVSDPERDMKQVVAEVNIGKDEAALDKSFSVLGETLQESTKSQMDSILSTDEIYKQDLVAYFLSYGYNYMSDSSSGYGQAFESVMSDLVSSKLQSQFAILYYLNAGKVLVDKDSIDNEDGYVADPDAPLSDGLKMDKEISLDGYLAAQDGKSGDEAAIAAYKYFLTQEEINYAEYLVMYSINQTIDSYESKYIDEESEETETTSDARTTPTGANVISDTYYPSVEKDGVKTIDYDIYTGSNNVSDCGEYEKVDGSSKYSRTRAYAEFITVLRNNYLISDSEKSVTDIKELSYYNVELKSRLEGLLITKFNATLSLKAANTITEDTIQQAYATEVQAQKASVQSTSSFTTTMDSVSDTSFVVYSPENKTYGFVYNILLPFNNQQTGKISEIKSYYTEGTKEYYAARNTNPELYQSIEAKDQRGTWFTGETDYSFDAQEKGYTDYYTQGGSSYLFFEDSYVTSNEGIDRYAGKYPFNGTVDKNEDGTYKLTYNKLNIVEFIGEMESYIDYVTKSDTATGKYYSGTAENIAQWNAATAEESTFYKVTADYFPKENGEINQSANIYYVGSVGAVTTEASAPENVLVKDSASYKAISAVNELMFAYSTDTGCLNKYYGYSIASIDETTSYVKEFEYAAQKAVTEGGIGTYYVVATDYGWHILYVSFVYDGTKNDEADLGNVFSTGFVYGERTTEGTFSYYYYQAKKSSIVSDYTSSKTSQINAQLNTDSVVTMYKDRYADLSSLS